ncbi:hypothetical protein [Aromatoleum buckelii]|uniref:Uncharacterized protein n=1 Tax=Aromatoleum buckelii TaxID=200254 RepID=A0ABX1N226_9RHOO|nr:hypothetical protein [Aromatoleum buckelii]MCK0512264.1 hypothetical protein [Aromatoleum buckelii]
MLKSCVLACRRLLLSACRRLAGFGSTGVSRVESALRLDYKEVVDTMNGCRFPLRTGRLLKINRPQFDGFPISHRLDTMSAEWCGFRRYIASNAAARL